MTGDQRSAAYYDPYDVEINADPYPAFARLREEAPVFHNEQYDFWALSRAADVEQAFINWRTFSNSRSDILDVIKANLNLPPELLTALIAMFPVLEIRAAIAHYWGYCTMLDCMFGELLEALAATMPAGTS